MTTWLLEGHQEHPFLVFPSLVVSIIPSCHSLFSLLQGKPNVFRFVIYCCKINQGLDQLQNSAQTSKELPSGLNTTSGWFTPVILGEERPIAYSAALKPHCISWEGFLGSVRAKEERIQRSWFCCLQSKGMVSHAHLAQEGFCVTE